MNTAFWYMKHAVLVAVKPEISMEDAKEVHTSLRKAAGLIKFVQVGHIMNFKMGFIYFYFANFS